jgi:glyceraldehyde-3-phosphate dehydrogenase/erythrose-4-phosphate dehydrogenase
MKVAIAGLGNIGKRWTEVLSQAPDVEVAVFVDPLVGMPQVFPWLAEHPNIPQVHHEWQRSLVQRS